MCYALVFAAPDRLSAAWSLLVVYGIGVVGLVTALVLAVSRLSHHLALRAQDGAAERETPVLQQGQAVLTGVVELDDPEVAGVHIRIEEQGREWRTKNGWAHEWKETSRTVVANPFHLALDHGERVRVVPDERVFLIDALTTVEQAGTVRTRQAALSHGEHVTIVGRLVWGRDQERPGAGVYRDGGASLSLQAPRGQQMLISAQSLALRHALWVRFYGATVALLTMALLAVNLGFGDFHRLRLTGERVSLPIVHHDTYQTTYKGHLVTHYRVAGLYQPDGAEGRNLVDEVTAETYAAVCAGRAEAPFVVVPGAPEIHQIGYVPTIHSAAGLMALIGAFVSLLMFHTIRKNLVPWYDQERVVEGGSGQLYPS